jgi:hypothetical protein
MSDQKIMHAIGMFLLIAQEIGVLTAMDQSVHWRVIGTSAKG